MARTLVLSLVFLFPSVAHANGLATLIVRLPPTVGCAKTVNEEVPGVVGADRKSDGKEAEEEKIELE